MSRNNKNTIHQIVEENLQLNTFNPWTATSPKLGIKTLALVANASTLEQNILLSPYGVAQALRIIEMSAKGGSEQARELSLVLGKKITSQPHKFGRSEGFMSCNIIWSKLQFNARFIKNITSMYGAFAESLPQYSKPIHERIIRNTQGRITGTTIEETTIQDVDVRLILMNLLYFVKVPWIIGFNKNHTYRSRFDTKYDCFMMNLNSKFHIREFDYGISVSIPYLNGMKAVFVLPDIGYSLAEFTNKLNSELNYYTQIRPAFDDSSHHVVDLHLPKFGFNASCEDYIPLLVNQELLKKHNDFTMVHADNKPAKLNRIVQRSMFQIDETGPLPTEIIDEITPMRIEFNRPFVFLIEPPSMGFADDFIFVGTVVQP